MEKFESFPRYPFPIEIKYFVFRNIFFVSFLIRFWQIASDDEDEEANKRGRNVHTVIDIAIFTHRRTVDPFDGISKRVNEWMKSSGFYLPSFWLRDRFGTHVNPNLCVSSPLEYVIQKVFVKRDWRDPMPMGKKSFTPPTVKHATQYAIIHSSHTTIRQKLLLVDKVQGIPSSFSSEMNVAACSPKEARVEKFLSLHFAGFAIFSSLFIVRSFFFPRSR